MDKIKHRYPDFLLTIVGALSEKKYYILMQKSIIEKGLENNIKIYPDVSFENILSFYKKCRSFCFMYRRRITGYSVFAKQWQPEKPMCNY